MGQRRRQFRRLLPLVLAAGKSSGPVITYTAVGSSYTVAEQTSLVVAAKC